MSQARRPSAPLDAELLKALGEARRLVLQLGAAERHYGSPRYRRCRDVQAAIDELAADVTGQPSYFAVKPHGGAMYGGG